jgi:hypothetical protein
MRRFLFSAAVVVLALAAAGTAQAGPKKPVGPVKKVGPVSPKPVYSPMGGYKSSSPVKFKYGYYYKGKGHCHWTCSCWDVRYGCIVYYCPVTCVWYYFCDLDDCYYPVEYCPYGVYCW